MRGSFHLKIVEQNIFLFGRALSIFCSNSTQVEIYQISVKELCLISETQRQSQSRNAVIKIDYYCNKEIFQKLKVNRYK